MRPVIIAVLGLAIFGSIQIANAAPRPSDEDRAIVCAVSEIALSTFGSIRSDADPETENRIKMLIETRDAVHQPVVNITRHPARDVAADSAA